MLGKRLKKQSNPSTVSLPKQWLRGRKLAFQVIALQALIVVIFACACYYFSDYTAFYSALMGGSICGFTTWYFAKQVFRAEAAVAPARQILGRFYRAEIGKWVLTVMLFAAVWHIFPIKAFALFSAYIGAQLAMWLAPLLFKPA